MSFLSLCQALCKIHKLKSQANSILYVPKLSDGVLQKSPNLGMWLDSYALWDESRKMVPFALLLDSQMIPFSPFKNILLQETHVIFFKNDLIFKVIG